MGLKSMGSPAFGLRRSNRAQGAGISTISWADRLLDGLYELLILRAIPAASDIALARGQLHGRINNATPCCDETRSR